MAEITVTISDKLMAFLNRYYQSGTASDRFYQALQEGFVSQRGRGWCLTKESSEALLDLEAETNPAADD